MKFQSEYNAWYHMVKRCTDSEDKNWGNYGGRGIKVCKKWRTSFHSFLADMGIKPNKESQIDRIDNNKGYSPNNCRWTTSKQQARNRRDNQKVMYKGKLILVIELAETHSMQVATLKYRLKKGWSVDDAIKTKVSRRKKHMIKRSNTKTLTFQNQTKTIEEWASQKRIPAYVIYYRINSGWSVDKIINTPTRKYHRK